MKEKINYSDQVGYDTLDSISQADRFNEWMFKTISVNTHGKVLEIGSGIGNISEYFVKNGYRIALSDMRKEYCDLLDSRYSGEKNFIGVYQIDIVDPDFDNKHMDLFGKFDSVFALNIIEHVENDQQALLNCMKLLKEGGTVVILVPAFMFLFNGFDEGLGHFRRYHRKSLVKLFDLNRIPVISSRYFNAAGVLGWWFTGNVLGKKEIPSGQMKLYNKLVWIFKLIDFVTQRFFGLSVIVAGKKKE